jgi:hypothetical protein
LYSPLKSSPFSAKALMVVPVVVYLGAKNKAAAEQPSRPYLVSGARAFLNEENVSVLPVGM